jgi:hypothetical protein
MNWEESFIIGRKERYIASKECLSCRGVFFHLDKDGFEVDAMGLVAKEEEAEEIEELRQNCLNSSMVSSFKSSVSVI